VKSGWANATMGDVITDIEAGSSFKCEERPPASDEIGVAKVSAVSWGRYQEQESKTCTDPSRVEPSFFVKPGDFLMSRANTIELVGACVIAEGVTKRIMLSDKILRLQFRCGEPAWFMHFLRSAEGRRQIEEASTGNQLSMRNISQGGIREIEVPFPPLNEQRRIVAKLEDLLARCRRAKDALEAIAEREDRALAFWAADSWPVRQLGELVQHRDERAGQSWSRYPVVGLSNEGVIVARREPMGAKGAPKAVVVHPGDVVYNPIRLSIGSIAVYRGTEVAIASPEYVVVRPQAISAELLVRYLRSSFGRSLLETFTTGSVRYRIYFGKFAELPVPAAPVLEQERAERFFRSLVSVASAREAVYSRLVELERAILGKAFRGELVEQDSKDEPASVMLERLAVERMANEERASKGAKARARKAR
jgi:type I restriction enzyme S subunit